MKDRARLSELHAHLCGEMGCDADEDDPSEAGECDGWDALRDAYAAGVDEGRTPAAGDEPAAGAQSLSVGGPGGSRTSSATITKVHDEGDSVDYELLAQLAEGEGRGVGALRRAGLISWTITAKGEAMLAIHLAVIAEREACARVVESVIGADRTQDRDTLLCLLVSQIRDRGRVPR